MNKVTGNVKNAEIINSATQPGDTLSVTRIDRLARFMKDLQDIVHELKSRGVHLKATGQPVDTSTAAGKAFLDMLGRVCGVRNEHPPGPSGRHSESQERGNLQGPRAFRS
jgi:hypothetical protein